MGNKDLEDLVAGRKKGAHAKQINKGHPKIVVFQGWYFRPFHDLHTANASKKGAQTYHCQE